MPCVIVFLVCAPTMTLLKSWTGRKCAVKLMPKPVLKGLIQKLKDKAT